VNPISGTAAAFFAALRDPATLQALATRELDRVLRTARRTGVLARLAILAERSGVDRSLPAKAQELFAAARPVAGHHERSIRLEVSHIRRALAPLGRRVVLLKGAAYVLAGVPAGLGRLVSDVDILVPKDRLADAERALLGAGWRPMVLDAYDQRYYRTWMHELPPLRHETRQTVLDVHHTILPETARRHPDPAKLLAAVAPLDDALAVLCAEDMVLHSATHLFSDGDLAGGVRDLVDLDALLRHFGENRQGFWDALVPRAVEHDLTRPLFYALRYCRAFLLTPVPDTALRASRVGAPSPATLALMDALCGRALEPRAEPSDWKARSALWMLYVRSHWMRMPPLLLARHLLIKAVRRRRAEP
jgi:hypothetical protein